MLKRWLNNRALTKFSDNKNNWEYRLHNQTIIKPYSKEELPSVELDKLSIMSRCATAQRLVESMEQLVQSMGVLEKLPRIKFVSRDKGEITLTHYLTNEDGYPYPVARADEDIRAVLIKMSTSLEAIRSTDDTKYSYYSRTIKPYVTEAIDFRVLVNGIT